MSAFRESNKAYRSRKIGPNSKTSESLSKANGSKSAPIELLTEFLFCVMKKEYEKALSYCSKILHYEPHNSTAQKFCYLIEEKLEINKLKCSSSESSQSLSADSSNFSESSSSEDETF